MKKCNGLTYAQKIQWRIRILRLLLLLMFIYMIVVGKTGGGDTRIMTDLAVRVSKMGFFGSIIWVVLRIRYNKKLLESRVRMKEQMLNEQDERNQYLHDKSGGFVMDALLVLLLCVTITTAMYNMAAFYTAYAIGVAAAALKVAAYLFYSHQSG